MIELAGFMLMFLEDLGPDFRARGFSLELVGEPEHPSGRGLSWWDAQNCIDKELLQPGSYLAAKLLNKDAPSTVNGEIFRKVMATLYSYITNGEMLTLDYLDDLPEAEKFSEEENEEIYDAWERGESVQKLVVENKKVTA